MGIGLKLSKLIEANNTNANELANKIGVSPQTIYSMIKRDSKKADIEVLLKIADVFGVSAEYFVYDNEPKNPDNIATPQEMTLIKKYRVLSEHGKEMVSIVLEKEYEHSMAEKNAPATAPTRLISYFYKNASAGTGQLLFDNLPDKDIEIPDIPEYKNVSYSISVNGSSMEPLYSDGDILLVEATQEIKIGEIGIFSVNNECYVKKVGETELISLNSEYPNIPLNETARCMGKVIDKL